jgi:hypothetical protein
MKYREINPEVFATQITNENRAQYTTPKMTPYVGVFAVTYPDGHQEFVPADEFLKKFKPALPMNDAKREMYRLCTDIIDLESLVDEDNAESLLAQAVEMATKLRKHFQ